MGTRRAHQGGRARRHACAAALPLLPVLVTVATPAGAAHVGCGTVITVDTVLHSDIGPCSRGIVIGADDVVLDLNGHRLFGTPGIGELMGILISDKTGVTITNGTVSDFDGGVTISLGGHNTVSKMTIEGNDSQRSSFGSGIAVNSSSDNVIEKNTIVDNGPFDGITLERGSHRNTVSKNEISGNGRDGIRVAEATSQQIIDKNTAKENGRDGVHLDGPILRLFFQNVGPNLFDVVAPDLPAFNESSDYRVMPGSVSGDVSAPLQAVDVAVPPTGANPNPPDSSTSGCEASDFVASGFSAGAVAILQRGTCSFQTKIDNAAAAGAAAVIIFNEGQLGRTSASFGALLAPSAVPVLSATYALGQSLNNALQAGTVIVHVVTKTVSQLNADFPGSTGNVLDKNIGQQNGRFDGFDGTLAPPCDANRWIKSDFTTVNQPCVVAT